MSSLRARCSSAGGRGGSCGVGQLTRSWVRVHINLDVLHIGCWRLLITHCEKRQLSTVTQSVEWNLEWTVAGVDGQTLVSQWCTRREHDLSCSFPSSSFQVPFFSSHCINCALYVFWTYPLHAFPALLVWCISSVTITWLFGRQMSIAPVCTRPLSAAFLSACLGSC